MDAVNWCWSGGLTFLIAQAQVDATAPSAPALTEVLGSYMGVFFVAFVLSFMLTPVARRVAMRMDVVDRPGDLRKIHTIPIAYLGGLAIFFGWLAGVGCSMFIQPHYIGVGGLTVRSSFPLSVVLGAAVILLTGLFDDLYGISPRVKIGGQLFAAAALASQDVGIRLAGQFCTAVQWALVQLPWPDAISAAIQTPMPGWFVYIFGTAVIAFFVIGGCNSMNLLDGMDGLAAGVAGIVATGFLLIAGLLAVDTLGHAMTGQSFSATLLINDSNRIVMCLAILGAVLGFLPFNFNPATIFMGDAGSLLIGYLSAATMLMFAQSEDSQALLAVTAGLIVFALPITDTSLAIFRRKMQGIPMSQPDARHLHHLLRRTGLSVRQTVVTLYGISIIFAALGVLLIAMDFRWRYVLAVAMVLYAFIFVTAYKVGLRYSDAVKQEKLRSATPGTPPPGTPGTAGATHLSQNPQASVSLDDDDEADAQA